VNAQLPDYAQINYFLVAIEPFSFSNQLTT
jgi:hypothetical protein